MNVTVHNVKGSSKISQKPPFPYYSWLNYWENNGGSEIKDDVLYKCPACGKAFTRKNFDGCHLQKISLIDRSWYIVPLCDSCNQRADMFSVKEELLVPVPSNL